MKDRQAAKAGLEFVISGDHAGQRLDNFLLRELRGVPRQLVYRLLRQGKARLNGSRSGPSARLAQGDVIAVPQVRTARARAVPLVSAAIPKVVHEDKHLLVFDKPAGLASHGGSGLSHGLIEAVRQHFGSDGYELAHRLDRDTSGLVVVARSRRGLRSFHGQLREGRVGKTYLALAFGTWSNKKGLIDQPLLKVRDKDGMRRSVVSDRGKRAVTHCRALQVHKRGVALELRLATGKMHQARAHLASVGNPIVGDVRYGDKEPNMRARSAGCKGLMLHASGLEFMPVDGEGKIALSCATPARFADAARWLDGDGQPANA